VYGAETRLASMTFPLLVFDNIVDVLDRPRLSSTLRSCMLEMLLRFDCPLAVLFRSLITSLEASALVGLPVDALVEVLGNGF
jgi:hypothetical protein